MEKRVVLITGASSGIGYDAAIVLARQGHKVYAGARRIQKMEKLKSYGVTTVELDVTDEASVEKAVNTVLEKENRIDVLINNAGYGYYGAIEDVSSEDAKRQFDVNVFGLIEITKKVLPIMRENRFGRIINISSAAGRVVNYLGGWYHASKYALEALSDALRMETKEFGIDVVLIEPGGIKTEWGIIAAENLKQSAKGGVYEQTATRVSESLKKHYSSSILSDPSVVSKAISKAVNKKCPKTRYLIGFGAKPLVFLHTILPARLFDKIVKHLN